MKRIIHTLLICILTILQYACFEDKGHYDYEYVEQVELCHGLRDTVIARGQRLKIVPQLQLLLKDDQKVRDTVAFEPERYEFQWRACQEFISSGSTILANTLNLDTVINLAVNDQAYLVIYSVTDKISGVCRNFTFKLRIGTRYEQGWLFLTEDNNQLADITIYGKEIGNNSENSWVYEDHILERSGFPYRGGGARFIYYNSNSKSKSGIFVGTGESAGWLSKNELAWNDKQLVRWIMTDNEHQSIDFTFENIVEHQGTLHFIASNGSIYPMGNSPMILGAYNVLPPNVTGGNYETVKLAPYIGGAGAQVVIYDETYKRMLSWTGSPANANVTATLFSGDKKKLALENHQVYFIQGYNNMYINVIAKNLNDGKFYKYTYYFAYPNAELYEPLEIVNGQLLEESAGSLDRTKQYVCDYARGNFYMAYGSKLYVLREQNLEEVTVLASDGETFTGFDPITLVTRYSTQKDIIVATYADGTEKSGKVYFLEPNTVEPRQLTIRTVHENLDRVKGISKF